jgi:hypothetical protein
MPDRIIILLLCFSVLLGCAEEKQLIVVVSKSLKKQRNTSTAVPDEFSSFAPAASGTSFWVEGSVRNEGDSDVSNVEIVFKCTEGVDTRVLVATIRQIPAGKVVTYKSKPFTSNYEVKLLEEEPEVVVGD